MITEVTVDEGKYARVASDFMILGEGLEHDDAGPPVVIGRGADRAVGGLVGEGPVEELLRNGFEAGVVEEPGEGNEAVEE